jgi:hypothetical protein
MENHYQFISLRVYPQESRRKGGISRMRIARILLVIVAVLALGTMSFAAE